MKNLTIDQVFAISHLRTVAAERGDTEVTHICEKAIKGNKRAIKEALDTYEHRIAAFGEL